ncbi:hypothetical protein [Rhodococcus sp. O3]
MVITNLLHRPGSPDSTTGANIEMRSAEKAFRYASRDRAVLPIPSV